jgi:pimeloyl-ACP methyl ester carboxylesterase/DNA-binding CsgD family transcriptional regulator
MEELEAVISAIGERKVALLGVSGGTPVAIAFAARYPERVSHLVLLGGSMMGALHRSTTPEDLGYLQAQWRLIETGWGRDDHEVLAFFSARFLPEATPEVRNGMNEQQRRSCDATRAVAILKGRAALDARALAPKVVAPTLVLHCDRDRVTPVALGRDTAAVIPGARFEALNSGNHVPLGHEPAFARFCEAVVEFVIDSTDRDLLTPRERDLARLVAQGLDNAQIAATLGVANKTVRNALSVLYRKLGVDSRARAVARTRDMGF